MGEVKFPSRKRKRRGDSSVAYAGILRVFSTGDPLYADDAGRQNDLTSYKVAEENINRLRSWGAVALRSRTNPGSKMS